MGIFGRGRDQRPLASAGGRPTAIDWSSIDAIRAEWPQGSLDSVRDLHNYRQALALYERDDYRAMMQCATWFATALAHSLHGPGILHGDDLPNAVHKALYCATCAPPDGRTFAESAKKAARLAMTVIRENGWQSASMGGSGLFQGLITQNYLLLTEAVAPDPDEPWSGDLKTFFAVPPTPLVRSLPDPSHEPGLQALEALSTAVEDADAGDTGSSLFLDGTARVANGDLAGAMDLLTQAAQMGSIDAMVWAGDVALDLGRGGESRFWYESAANAGSARGMIGLAMAAHDAGDRPTETHWFQRAAEAGYVEAYAALTQIARDAGDDAAVAHWAELGAEAGQTFCMCMYGLVLLRQANGDVPTLRRAREYLEQAAERGDIDSAGAAVNANHQLGDSARAARFVEIVVRSGDAQNIERLRRYGYL